MPYLTKQKPEERMNRWYFVSVQASLFHSYAVVIGRGSRENDFQQWRIIPADLAGQAQDIAYKIIRKKLKKGYQQMILTVL
jgi:predicted DNA-binding WGR domain protein